MTVYYFVANFTEQSHDPQVEGHRKLPWRHLSG